MNAAEKSAESEAGAGRRQVTQFPAVRP